MAREADLRLLRGPSLKSVLADEEGSPPPPSSPRGTTPRGRGPYASSPLEPGQLGFITGRQVRCDLRLDRRRGFVHRLV